MNSLNIFGLTLLVLVVMFVLLRVERRGLWLVLLLLVAPAIVLVGGWASLGGHLAEVGLALVIALALTLVWWLAYGRRLTRASSDSIRVWGQEKLPKIKPDEARALKSENAQLREQNELLEAELRQLKTGTNGGHPPSNPLGPN